MAGTDSRSAGLLTAIIHGLGIDKPALFSFAKLTVGYQANLFIASAMLYQFSVPPVWYSVTGFKEIFLFFKVNNFAHPSIGLVAPGKGSAMPNWEQRRLAI